MEKDEPRIILEEDKPIGCIFIIRDGMVGSKIEKQKCVEFINTMNKVPAKYTFIHTEPASLFAMKKEYILKFEKSNPALSVKLV